MKKDTYQRMSGVLLLVLVASAVGAQRYSRAEVVFGCLAILSALGSFVLYVKAFPKEKETTALAVASPSATLAPVAEEHVRESLEALLASRLRKDYERALDVRQVTLFDGPSPLDLDIIAYAHALPERMKIRRVREHDPSFLIANIVERICASKKEPRFEFILSPDGTFTIKQLRLEEPLHFAQEEAKDDSSQLIH